MFYTWIADVNVENAELLSPSEIVDDSQCLQGFKAGTAASAKRVNTALRQSTLAIVALIEALGFNNDVSLTMPVNEVKALFNSTNLFKLSNAFTAGTNSTTVLKNLLPSTNTTIGSSGSYFLSGYFSNLTATNLIASTIKSTLLPDATNSRNLGSSTKKFQSVYATTFYGALNGNASSATNANDAIRAQYASVDTSKGTIEERLTNLGFKQGSLKDTSNNTIATLTRIGYYVLVEVQRFGSGSIFISIDGSTLDDFKPRTHKSNTIRLPFQYGFDGPSGTIIVACDMSASGTVSIVRTISGFGDWMFNTTTIDLTFGYDIRS